MMQPPDQPLQPAETTPDSMGELFQTLSADSSLLIRQEVALAKAEMQQKIDKVVKDVGMIAGGAGLAMAGGLALLIALIWGVAQFFDPDQVWLSALIIGVLFVAIGGFFAYSAVQKIKEIDPMPQQTIETLQEDKQWAKNQLS